MVKTLFGMVLAFVAGVEYARRHSVDPWGELHESLKRAGKRVKKTVAFDTNTDGEEHTANASEPVTEEGAVENGQEQRDQQQDNLH